MSHDPSTPSCPRCFNADACSDHELGHCDSCQADALAAAVQRETAAAFAPVATRVVAQTIAQRRAIRDRRERADRALAKALYDAMVAGRTVAA